jgi:hypothetical protein
MAWAHELFATAFQRSALFTIIERFSFPDEMEILISFHYDTCCWITALNAASVLCWLVFAAFLRNDSQLSNGRTSHDVSKVIVLIQQETFWNSLPCLYFRVSPFTSAWLLMLPLLSSNFRVLQRILYYYRSDVVLQKNGQHSAALRRIRAMALHCFPPDPRPRTLQSRTIPHAFISPATRSSNTASNAPCPTRVSA